LLVFFLVIKTYPNRFQKPVRYYISILVLQDFQNLVGIILSKAVENLQGFGNLAGNRIKKDKL
jgi:hypothetical protein